jgi:hypothetical protein
MLGISIIFFIVSNILFKVKKAYWI